MAEDELSREGRRSGVTLRAVGLGLVSVVFLCWLANYQLHVTWSSEMSVSNFPLSALIAFLVWVMLNSIVRAVAPRRALRPEELLTILIMSWAAAMMPARGWAIRLVGELSCVQHFASAENRWAERVGGLLPRWLFPALTDEGPANQAGNWFYVGVPEGRSWPWWAWGPPLFWWGTAAMATLGMAASVTVIFHRQWVVYERLTFPLATMPMDLVQVRPGERVAPLFKKKLFWIGFAAVAGVLCWNLGGYLSHAWPKIEIYRGYWPGRREYIPGFPQTAFRVMPLVIGFLYLCNLDLLFSLWFFWLLGWIEAGCADTLGLSVGSVGRKLNGTALVSAHNYGALILLAIWSIWVARRHLRAVWRAAVSRHRVADNPGGAMSYRTAIVVLIGSLTFLVLLGTRMGMSLAVAIPALLLVLVSFFVIAKYMAATGMAYLTPPTLAAGEVLETLIGSSWMSRESVVGMGLMHGRAFGNSPRVFGYPMLPHALKMGEAVTPRRSRILWVVVLAIAVGASFSIWHVIALGYHRTALQMDETSTIWDPQRDIEAIATRVDAVSANEGLPPDVEKIGAWGVGFIGAAVLMLCYGRFGWWHLHPLGLAFSASDAGRYYWFSIFIAWLLKSLILKSGGVRAYEKAKPFFYGLIIGYIFALMVSYGVHEFFPGQLYQVYHDA